MQGLFSVSTTSTKSPAVIRQAIIETLDQLGVSHRTIKAGFECAHAPSIDLASVALSPRPDHGHDRNSIFGQPESPTPDRKRSIKRTTRIGLPRSPFSKDKELDKEASLTRADSAGPAEVSQSSLPQNRATSSSSFTMLSHPQPSGDTNNNLLSPPSRPGTATTSPKAPNGMFIDTSNGPTNAQDMIVRFEIFIIKVPWLPGLHGIQFRRISGSAWQYSQLGKLVYCAIVRLEVKLTFLGSFLSPYNSLQIEPLVVLFYY